MKGGLIYIVNPSHYDARGVDDASGVGFPVDYVFAFDEKLYSRLRSAYEGNDQAGLWTLWQQAAPFKAERVDA